MKPNWLRYLNPFYFEVRFLKWTVWGNVVACCLIFAPFAEALSGLRPLAMRLGYQRELSAEQLDRISDISKLRKITLTEDYYNHIFWRDFAHILNSMAVFAAGLILLLLVNAFYLHKAHQLLNSKEASVKSEQTLSE